MALSSLSFLFDASVLCKFWRGMALLGLALLSSATALAAASLEAAKPIRHELRRRSRTLRLELTLGSEEQMRYRIEQDPRATPEQVQLRDGWLAAESERGVSVSDR